MTHSKRSEAVFTSVQDSHSRHGSWAGETNHHCSRTVDGPKTRGSGSSSGLKSAGTRSRIGFTGKAFRWVGCALIGAACVILLAGPVVAYLDPLLTDGLDEHKSKNYARAVELYTTALKKNPHSPEAFNWRGMAYDELGELDKALGDYEEALRLEPKYADAYNNRGEVYRKQNKLKLAISDFRKAIELDKKFAEPHFNLAIIYEQQGDKPSAATEYRAYLNLAPTASDKNDILKKVQALGKGTAAATRPEPRRGTTPRPRVAQKPGEAKPGVRPSPRPGAPKPGERKPGVQAPGRPGAPRTVAPRPGAPGKAFGTEKKAPAIPGLPPDVAKQIPPDVVQWVILANQLGPIIQIAELVLWVLFSLFLFLIARKLGVGLAWFAFIPILQLLTMVRCAGKPVLWFILLLVIPILMGVVPIGLAIAGMPGGPMVLLAAFGVLFLIFVLLYLLICIGIARERGKSALWGILVFLPPTQPIGMAYLALSR